MGCDIHVVVEKKVSGKWTTTGASLGHHESLTEQDRREYFPTVANVKVYERFAALAGVRGRGPAARGLPSDISETTKRLSDGFGRDGHSHSWLPIEQAAKIFLETDDEYLDSSGCDIEDPVEFFFNTKVAQGEQDLYRLVFWFDS